MTEPAERDRKKFAGLDGVGSTLGVELLEASPDCVKLLDVDGKLRFMNVNGMCLLEIDDFARFKGQPWSSLWPAASETVVTDALAEARAGRVTRFAESCPTAKGSLKWWDVVVSPVHDGAGKLIYILSTSRDITQQKQVEESLRIGQQRFRALADNIAQFAWMADASGYIYWYNQRWFDYTGTTLEEMAGWGWQSVHHPDHLERVVAKFKASLDGGSIWEDTFPLRAVDGSYRWFLSRAMPIRDDQGNVVLWCGTNTDVTDQRRASQRLSQLARLIELSHEAILVWDMTGGVLLWNRGCAELFGFSESEALGADSFGLLPPRDDGPTRDELLDVLKREGAWSGELPRVAKDGREVWVDCRLELIRVGDTHVVLETNRDVTERRHADEIRNLLIAELNHRVKNTLAIVQSLASQTARCSPTVPEFVSSFSGRLQSLSSAHNVLNDSNWTGAGVSELIRSQIGMATGNSDRIQISGPDVSLPPQTALQLTQILHELSTNAMKHGALSQPASVLSVTWDVSDPPDRKLRLTWQETGAHDLLMPTSRGFGLNLIERSGRLPHLTTKLEFTPLGVTCLITADVPEKSAAERALFDPGKKKLPHHGAA